MNNVPGTCGSYCANPATHRVVIKGDTSAYVMPAMCHECARAYAWHMRHDENIPATMVKLGGSADRAALAAAANNATGGSA